MAVIPEEPAGPIAPLSCGRDAATVWDRAEAGHPRDQHETGCPFCGAVFDDADRLHSVVNRMAAEEFDPPPGVLERAMQVVRTEFRQCDALTLDSPHGPVRLSRPAAAAVLRHAVDLMPGVRARSCRIEQVTDPHGPSAVATVTITIAAGYGVDLSTAATRVRQMVIAAGEHALGLPVRRVDIVVVDLLAEPAQPDRPQRPDGGAP